MRRWGFGGVLDISPNRIIKSILTDFVSITFPSDIFFGDTLRASFYRSGVWGEGDRGKVGKMGSLDSNFFLYSISRYSES